MAISRLQAFMPSLEKEAPSWLLDDRLLHHHAFLKAGLPTHRDDYWKHMDLTFLEKQTFSPSVPPIQAIGLDINRLSDEAILLVSLDGYLQPSLSDLKTLPEEVIFCSIHEALLHHEDLLRTHWGALFDAKRYPFAAFNAAHFNDGFFLYVPDDCIINYPIHLVYLTTSHQTSLASVNNKIVLGKNTQVTLFEEHLDVSQSSHWVNLTTTITMDEGCRFDYCKIQKQHLTSIHFAHTFIEQQKNSESYFTYFSEGGGLARDDIKVNLKAENAHCSLSGLYELKHPHQTVNYDIDIEHLAPCTTSEMFYKGILDHRTRAIFNGKVTVKKDAKKIKAEQTNHHLLLSKSAEAYSKPQLEIYADDVKCKHGATVGQLNQDVLFYLRSRGISESEAISLLLKGFGQEVRERITHPLIQTYLNKRIA